MFRSASLKPVFAKKERIADEDVAWFLTLGLDLFRLSDSNQKLSENLMQHGHSTGVGIDVPTFGDFENHRNKYLLEMKYPQYIYIYSWVM